MQLFSADATIFFNKLPSKVAHNHNFFFHYCQLAQNQPKAHILFHKNGSLRDFYIMTGCISRDPTSRPTCFTFHCCLFRSTLVSRKKCIEFSIGNTLSHVAWSFFVLLFLRSRVDRARLDSERGFGPRGPMQGVSGGT